MPNNNRTTTQNPLKITLVISQHKARKSAHAARRRQTSRKAAEEVEGLERT